jgi:hypothetical protein
MSNTTDALIELRRHYEQIIAQSEFQVTQASAQLKRIDALLVDGLLQGDTPPLNAVIEPGELPALSAALISAAPAISSDPESQVESSTPAPARAAASELAVSDRSPRPLRPDYEGLKRLEAIAKALQTTPGQDMKIDGLIQELFGTLSSADQKSERKRLNTLLYKGEKMGLWKKGSSPSTYKIDSQSSPSVSSSSKSSSPKVEVSSPKAKTTAQTTKSRSPKGGRDSLPMLPQFEGMTKLEAISSVLGEQSGHVLHQDSIIQLLYGDLSPEVLSEETRRLRASLFQGVRKGLWQKAPKQPSSYIVKGKRGRSKNTEANNGSAPAETSDSEDSLANASSASKPASTRKNIRTVRSKTSRSDGGKSASRGREQVLSLPEEFNGLSKIDAVSKVLSEHPGTVVHIEDIIEQFYGQLSKEDLKAEKDRMKDVMTRGVKRGLWSRAVGIPSSFVVKG